MALIRNISRVMAAVCVLLSGARIAPAEDITFRHHVMPVLAKAGCNSGACHGNLNGKGGFKLSLRGEDPGHDFAKLTRDQQGRRINLLTPGASLLLRKATAAVPHDGGQRFADDSLEYRLIRDWIAGGAKPDGSDLPRLVSLEASPATNVLVEPVDSVQLRVAAAFSDGSQRDVTSLAVYELSNLTAKVTSQGLVQRIKPGEATVLVRFNTMQKPVCVAFVPARPDFRWSNPPGANAIDELVYAKLKTLRMNPSPPASDSEFLRRVYLDVIGLPPTAAEARAFVADKRADKRDKLVDALLKRPEFNDHWALKWSDLLRNEERMLDAKGVRAFHHWIRGNIAANKPVSAFVSDMLVARGSTYQNPAANFYRANRSADVRAEAVAQLFLGTRMQCAKCHNHPFDRWTQNDYYSFAAFFAPIEYKIVQNNARDKNDKMMFIGEQLVVMNPKTAMKNPSSGQTMKPAFLGDGGKVDDKSDTLEALADWMARNPRFAAAQVNRIWFHLMGKGLVDPIDDFRDTNPASNPALLAALTRAFVDAKFDLRAMVRLICTSRTYQLSSQPTQDNEEDESSFSRAYIRRWNAEQLLDAMSSAMDTPLEYNGVPLGYRAAQIPGVHTIYRDRDPSPADRFLTLFGKPPRLMTCECERSNDTTLGQVLELTSGQVIDSLLTADDNLITRLLREKRSNEEIVEELYWATLSRAPSAAEMQAALRLVAQTKDRRTGLEDVAWGLLNAKEFLLRR